MDRDALLAAIKAHHKEDTPRLMYADWLQEHGSTDLDRATEEFIRVSCPVRVEASSNLMPRAAYLWLENTTEFVTNWKRLVPSVLNLHHPDERDLGRNPNWYRHGRKIWLGLRLRRPTRKNPNHCFVYSTDLEFWKGFLVGHSASWTPAAVMKRGLKIDQPLYYSS